MAAIPFIIMGVSAVAGAVGASKSAAAAKSAAAVQSASADKAIALETQQYNDQKARLQPFVDAGTAATNRMSALLTPNAHGQYQPFSSGGGTMAGSPTPPPLNGTTGQGGGVPLGGSAPQAPLGPAGGTMPPPSGPSFGAGLRQPQTMDGNGRQGMPPQVQQQMQPIPNYTGGAQMQPIPNYTGGAQMQPLGGQAAMPANGPMVTLLAPDGSVQTMPDGPHVQQLIAAGAKRIR